MLGIYLKEEKKEEKYYLKIEKENNAKLWDTFRIISKPDGI